MQNNEMSGTGAQGCSWRDSENQKYHSRAYGLLAVTETTATFFLFYEYAEMHISNS